MTKLSPAMEQTLIDALEGGAWAGSGTASTWAALMRRGLVHDHSTPAAGTLTEEGKRVAQELATPELPEAVEEPDAAGVVWAGRTMGQLTPEERRKVTTWAAQQLQQELSNPALAEAVLGDPLEAPMQADPNQAARDAYWTQGCGADVLQRDRELAEQDQLRAAAAAWGEGLGNEAGPAGPALAPVAGEFRVGQIVRAHGGQELREVLAVREGLAGQELLIRYCDPDKAGEPDRWTHHSLVHLAPVLPVETRTAPQEGQVTEAASTSVWRAVGGGFGPWRGQDFRVYRLGDDLHLLTTRLDEPMHWAAGHLRSFMAGEIRVGATLKVDGRLYRVTPATGSGMVARLELIRGL